MEMQRTRVILEDMRNVLNTNPKCQQVMTELACEAEKEGLSYEEWQQLKQSLFNSLFYGLAIKCPEIREAVAEDIYEELREEN